MRRLFLALFLTFGALAQTNTPSFPAAIPSSEVLPWANDNAETKLTSTITANSRSFTVLDPQKFKKLPTFVTIFGPAPEYTNREIILVCSIQGNTLYVCPNGRGFNSDPAPHKYGDHVEGLIVSHYINQLIAELRAGLSALGVNLTNVIRTGQAAGGDLDMTYPNPRVKTVGGGKVIPVGDLVGTSDTQIVTNKTVTGTFYGPLHGNADTASTAEALAADPDDCTVAGQYARTISATGNLGCKAVDWTELTGRPSSMPPNGAATGDLGGFYPNPTVATVGGKTAVSIANTVDIVALATDSSVPGTLLKRSATGGVMAETFTGAFLGNATTATSLYYNPAGCDAGKYAIDADNRADLQCEQVQFSQLGGLLAPSQLPDSGVTATAYGSGTAIPVLNIDAKGRILSASTAAIDPQAYRLVQNSGVDVTKQSTLNFTAGLVASHDPAGKTVVGLGNTGVPAGTYGSEVKSVQIQVGADGRIASITELTIPGTDGSGYVTIYDGAAALLQRNSLGFHNGLTAADDGVGKTMASLAPSGVSAGSYGNSGSALSINVDTYGRIVSVSATAIAIAGSQVTSGTIPNARLNATSINNANTVVLRDNSGNFAAGTITANLVGNVQGVASSATNVAWSGITSKPVALANVTANGWIRATDLGCGSAWNAASCDANQNGVVDNADSATTAASASAVPWTGITGKPTNIVLADNTWYNININGSANYANTAGSANSVAWAAITSKPANIVMADGGSWNINVLGSANTANSATTAGSAGNWTGLRPFHFAYGDGTGILYAMDSPVNVWRSRNYTASFSVIGCQINSGSMSVTFTFGGSSHTQTCTTTYSEFTPPNLGQVTAGNTVSFQITSVTGSPTSMVVSGEWTRQY